MCRMEASSLEISQFSVSVNISTFIAERMLEYSFRSSRPSHTVQLPWRRRGGGKARARARARERERERERESERARERETERDRERETYAESLHIERRDVEEEHEQMLGDEERQKHYEEHS